MGPLDWWELVDDDPEVFLRSWLWPVLNWTRSGDVGCDGRLGEEFA